MRTKPSRSLWAIALSMLALSVMSYVGRTAMSIAGPDIIGHEAGRRVAPVLARLSAPRQLPPQQTAPRALWELVPQELVALNPSPAESAVARLQAGQGKEAEQTKAGRQ